MFSVPQIPKGETISPSNKFTTTPVEPAQMHRWLGGSWRGGGREEEEAERNSHAI